jgi:PBSX family phage terminase large subunit
MQNADFFFSKKQQEFLRYYPDARINILQGAVRSGKTYISLFKFAIRVKYSEIDSVFMLIALTSNTLKRNVLDTLMSIVSEDNFSYSLGRKEAWLFGRHILLEFAPDERAEQKIRGLTLDGAYCDELTLYPESFFSMLLSRLSKPNACVYATTNPDNPMHWLKEKYIDREDELNLKSWFFAIDDNTFLDLQYVHDLKLEYTGVFYQRFILGQWVIADGLVYSAFDRESMTIDTPSDSLIMSDYAEKYVAIDYGIQNPTAYVLAGWHKTKQEWHILREWKYGGKDGVLPKTDPELYGALRAFAEPYNIQELIIDPSAESFAQLIHKDKRFRVRDANNEVLKGISFVNTCFHQYKLKVAKGCKELLKELWSYSWDTEKSRKTGTDVVIKENDHLCDALRYLCATIIMPKTRLYGIVMPSQDRIEQRSVK